MPWTQKSRAGAMLCAMFAAVFAAPGAAAPDAVSGAPFAVCATCHSGKTDAIGSDMRARAVAGCKPATCDAFLEAYK